ncbi:MAG: sulfatase-like hydrolase/transferase [Dehalococcoidia bacterium]|nr:sulfatase-like hydrolase/transferase [Dehalococcoidia bacterium]
MPKPFRYAADFVKGSLVAYPVLLAIFPVLFLWSHNIGTLPTASLPDIVLPTAVSGGATMMLTVLAGLVIRDMRKAGLVVSLFLMLFFFYGRTFDALLELDFLESLRQRYFLLACILLLGLAGFLILRSKANLGKITYFLNVVSIVLVLSSAASIVIGELGTREASDGGTSLAALAGEGALDARTTIEPAWKPDIYYIILDAHASSGYLERSLGYDDKRFFDYLAGKGFYVVEGGRSNYGNTTLSLASSLNMEHLIDLTVTPAEDSQDSSVYNEMIRENKVMKFLRSRGYQMFHFKESWMPRAHEEYGDQYFGCGLGTLLYVWGGEFTSFLLQTTILEPVLRQSGLIASSYQSKGLCEIARLLEVRKIHGPKFVYGHLSIPHPPFVFGRDGDLVDDASGSLTLWSSRQAYLNQMIFVDKKVEEIVEQILSGPGDPPVVIIQADHGTGFFGEGFSEEVYEERFSIINALYLPAGGEQDLYPSITPVNSFRVVFNRYFDAGLKLEEDISYYTNFDEGWFNFLDVTDEAKLD